MTPSLAHLSSDCVAQTWFFPVLPNAGEAKRREFHYAEFRWPKCWRCVNYFTLGLSRGVLVRCCLGGTMSNPSQPPQPIEPDMALLFLGAFFETFEPALPPERHEAKLDALAW